MEYEKVGEALCRWLDSQEVKPQVGLMALASAIGAMMGSVANNVPDLIDGLGPIKQLMELEAFATLANRNKLTLTK